MAKLTKKQAKLHAEACELLAKDELTFDEKWFVYEHWQEGANHVNGQAGAFFTPPALASDFAIEVAGSKVIDLCAGIGVLSFMYYHRQANHDARPAITCVEINPAYVEVGKKLLPEATWLRGDVFEVCKGLGGFYSAIGNPPFGRNVKGAHAPRYRGSEFEYKVIDLASDLAEFGAFIVPRQSAGFRYSGAPFYERYESTAYRKFAQETGLYLEAGCGIDTTVFQDDWHGGTPAVEVVTCDFSERKPVVGPNLENVTFPAPEREQMSLL